MRIFSGLDDIHSKIDEYLAEWLGEEVEEAKSPERVNLLKSEAEPEIEPEPEFEPEAISELQIEPEVEVVNVIPQKDESHSWLYKEVLKAIRASVGDGKNTKVVAVFVPVVQNVKEFESLPVDETITIDQPAQEELPEPLVEVESVEPEIEIEPEPEPTPEPEPEPEPEITAMGEEFNLFPEGQDEPDAELAGAFQTIEDNLDENFQKDEAEQEPVQETEIEFLPVIEEAEEPNDVMAVSEGEPLSFSEIDSEIDNGIETETETETIELPELLDDDEIVFDDSIFEGPLSLTEDNDEAITIDHEDPEETEPKEN